MEDQLKNDGTILSGYDPANDTLLLKLSEQGDFDLKRYIEMRSKPTSPNLVVDIQVKPTKEEKKAEFLMAKSKHIESRLSTYDLLLQYKDQIPDTEQSMVYSATHKVATNWWQPLITVLSLDKRYKVLNKRTNRKVTAFLNQYGNSAFWAKDGVQEGKLSNRTKRHKTTYKDILRANRLIKEIILDSKKAK